VRRRCLLAACAAWGVLAAGRAVATAGALWLNSPLSVREAGMGQASLGSGDLLRAWSNPALLAGLETRGAVELSGGSLYGGDMNGLGLGAGWLLSPSLAVGAMAANYDSKFAEVNPDGDETGNNLARGLTAAGLAAAWRGSWLRAGVLAKTVSDKLAGSSVSALAVDVGAAASLGGASIGVAARNLGGDLRPAQGSIEAEGLPTEIRAGACYALKSPRLLAGAEFVHARANRVGGGLEWWPAALFAVRAGAVHLDATQLQITAGLSAVYSRFSLDYAAVTHPLGLNHRVSLSFGFGQAVEAPAPRASEETGMAPASTVPEGSRKNIAVADLSPQNVSGGDAAVISDMLRSEMIRAGQFNVVEKQNMEKILAEQAFQQTGCTSEGCAVKIGKLLNVRLMVVGSFGKLLTEYFVTIRVIDVENGKSVYAKTERAANVNQVETAVKGMVKEMSTVLR